MKINTILHLLREKRTVCEVHYSAPFSYGDIVHARINKIDDDYVSFFNQDYGFCRVEKIVIESQKITLILEA